MGHRCTWRRWLLMPMTAFAVGAPGAPAQETVDLTGRWSGMLTAGAQQIEIVYNLQVGADDALIGTMDVPAQGATGIPLTTVDFDGRTLSLTFPVPGGGSYEGALSEDGGTITGTFTQAGQNIPMDLSRGEPAPPPTRPQEPRRPFPYEAIDVSFANEHAGVTLAGTLTIPHGSGPFPAAVLVSGSGPQDRDESLLGHKPFLVLADHLTRNGIAVLRYDDRGVGASTGDFSAATSADFADDALAAIHYLMEDNRVAPDAIGIVGHSEGGLVGPLAASRSEAVDYVVMLAGPGVTGLEVLVEQGRLINEAAGVPPEISEFNATLQTRLAAIASDTPDQQEAAERMNAAIDELAASTSPLVQEALAAQLSEESKGRTIEQMNSTWFRYFMTYDPRPALERTNVPVLALFGAKDLQVPPEQSSEEVRAALVRGGNDDATVRVMPGLNHLFQQAGTGSPTEYQSIEETFNVEALSVVSEWITRRFGVLPTAVNH
ncbi:MAG: alpha/beta hydrolase [Gemmatimonadota bacterium]|nr:alpha/beta hydrolase [Gemmatimonadota bacterium]